MKTKHHFLVVLCYGILSLVSAITNSGWIVAVYHIQPGVRRLITISFIALCPYAIYSILRLFDD